MKLFQGVIVPMVTPINQDYSIDEASVVRMVDLLVKENCAPFVLGSTGEGASCSTRQKRALVSKMVEASDSRITTFAGISGTSLGESIEEAKAYKDLGIDVLVTTLPYYFPISDAEMTAFFEQLADAIDAPLVIYNMPAMVGTSIPLEVAEVLSKHPNIIGMKDSERDLDRINKSMEMWKDRQDFGFYIGWAAQSAHCVLSGADGLVPSTGNFAPELFHQLYQAAINGNEPEARRLQHVTDQLSLVYQKGRKLNTSLPALKVIMSELGLCKPHAIPPMMDIGQEEQGLLKQQIREALIGVN